LDHAATAERPVAKSTAYISVAAMDGTLRALSALAWSPCSSCASAAASTASVVSGSSGAGVSLTAAASVNPDASNPLLRVKATDLVRLGSSTNLACLVISQAPS